MAAGPSTSKLPAIATAAGRVMARVIVIVTLMVLITATMFAITRKSAVAPDAAANGATTTVKLADLPKAEAPPEDVKEDREDEDGHSLTAVDPRPVTNAIETEAAPKSAQEVTNGPVAGAAPSVGSAGIDHKGNASFTGTATPGDTVTLVLDGKSMGSGPVDEAGNWEVRFKAPVAKTEHELYASAQSKDGTVVIGPQRTTIRPPATDGGLPRITIKSADQTATTLQEGHVATAPGPKTGLVVEKITNGDAGLTTLTGKADPGATVKAAINGKPAGDTVVATDGSFTLAATNPSGKAAKRVRLELVGADGQKIDEADLPHDVPAAPKLAEVAPKPETKSDAAPKEVAALATPPATTTEAEQPKVKIIRVRRGDSLWRIAKRHVGKGRRWTAFYKANKRKIDNPDLIYPGQTLIIPG
jgi:LysM repeat protein